MGTASALPAERLLVNGNEAIGWGALAAGCDAFFGYPITPQNEVIEWFASEFPRRGKVFVQSQSETGTINMLLGAAATGVRAITSTASPGWALMQETISHMAAMELPCVIVLVQRGGPGSGGIRHSQTDYVSVTRGGGAGGYHTIVLAPSSVQEAADHVQLAFHLADKYLTPVHVLSDAMTGQTMEPLQVRTLGFGAAPQKDWAVRGAAFHEGGKRRDIFQWGRWGGFQGMNEGLQKKYRNIAEAESRCEEYCVDDARLVLVAFGYMGRCCKAAVRLARARGIKAGLVRPITLWPFPQKAIDARARQGCRFLVVEDNMGLMVDDVLLAAQCRTEVHSLTAMARRPVTDAGIIYPDRVLQEIETLM